MVSKRSTARLTAAAGRRTELLAAGFDGGLGADRRRGLVRSFTAVVEGDHTRRPQTAFLLPGGRPWMRSASRPVPAATETQTRCAASCSGGDTAAASGEPAAA
jgi:hypothetical protein